jgi:predicted DNA-binding ribbon-helix-helix protein
MRRYVMPTKNPRINVALEKPVYSTIEKLAHKRGLSLSMVTRELIGEALEIHEDTVLAKIAEKRENTLASRKTLSHDEVWK